MSYTVEHRGAAGDVLHEVVRRGLPVFEARLRHEDRHIPSYIERALESYLGCGDVTLGFGWLACLGCDHQRLLAFSCKTRSFCPTCMSRRMAERSAAWVDGLFPYRRVRQWCSPSEEVGMARSLPDRTRHVHAAGAPTPRGREPHRRKNWSAEIYPIYTTLFRVITITVSL